MTFCTTANVRLFTNLAIADISDADVTNLIAEATAQVNQDIQVHIIREPVTQIDSTRENTIDGSNKTFYVERWKNHFIGDGDNDGDVDTSDITVYQVDSDSAETTLTVSSITHNEGKYVLSSAPSSGVSLYVSYYSSPVDMNTPHLLIKHATIYYTAAMSYAKINLGKAPRFKAGNFAITRHMDSYNQYYNLYIRTIDKIREHIEIVEAVNLI